jgi:hypothetical protein
MNHSKMQWTTLIFALAAVLMLGLWTVAPTLPRKR